MKEKRPFFSVIMTTYNRERLIVRALTSLINQTETDWELILIDDGSTDRTAEVIEPYVLNNPQIQYQYQSNQGFIAGKNAGIKQAEGLYITFLDSDDEYNLNHLKWRKRYLLNHQDIDLLHGGVRIIGSEYVPDARHPERQIHLSDCAVSGTFFIRRDTLCKMGGFQGNELTTDADFMRRAGEYGLKIVKTEQPTYIYHRDVESSVTLDMLRKQE